MRDALAHIDAQQPGLIDRFGGHAMAAGLTLSAGNLQNFTDALQALAMQWLGADALNEVLWTDGALDEAELTREQAEAIRMAGPWGQGIPFPMFDNVFDVCSWQVLKEKHLKLRLRLPGSTHEFSAIQFGAYHGDAPPLRIRAVYELMTNDFREKRDFQCLIRYYEPV
jgi:single-stranded-DNA-specific exonuclease